MTLWQWVSCLGGAGAVPHLPPIVCSVRLPQHVGGCAQNCAFIPLFCVVVVVVLPVCVSCRCSSWTWCRCTGEQDRTT